MDKENTVVLDLGNVLNPNADSVINQIKLQAFVKSAQLLDCKAMNVGPLDISGDNSFLNREIKGDLPPLITANLKAPERLEPFIKKYAVIEVNGIKLGITGFIPNLDPQKVSPEFTVLDPETELRQILPELEKKSDFIVLLSQSRIKQTLELMDRLKHIDLGLCIDNSYLLSLGDPSSLRVMNVITRSQNLGIVEIEKKAGKTAVKDAARVQLSKDVASDPEVDALVEEAKNEIARYKQALRHKQNKKKAKEFMNMTPQEFIKSYNKTDK